MLFPALDHSSESSPLIFNPDSIKILGLFAEHDHYLCGFECIIYVGLVMLRYFVAKAHAAEENLVSFFCQGIVKLVSIITVVSSVNVMLTVAVLEADKYVIGLFLACLFKPFNSDALYLLCLLFVCIRNILRCKCDCLANIIVFNK